MWVIWFCVFTIASAQYQEPEVHLKQGNYAGIVNDGYIAFYGIPYAGPTSGKNRFKAPTELPPGEPRSQTIVAVNYGVKCAQIRSQFIVGVEDCLEVDIFTKDLKTSKPVFVWLESEDYERTSNVSYPLENLARKGLVVVSVKYRLSIFGFLCLGVPEAPGNAGLKDILLALKWIKNNIAAFGGNPNNVMLVGHGSGAALVDLITLSPSSTDFIHKAVALSGSALAPWAMSIDPIESAQVIAQKLKYTDKTPSELGKLFETTDFHVLGGALSKTFGSDYFNNPPNFAPCVENPKLDGTLIAYPPIDILRSGNYNDVPYVAVFTDWEGTMRDHQTGYQEWLYNVRSEFKKLLPADLKFESDRDEKNITKMIKEFYFEREIKLEMKLNFLKYESDVLVIVPVTRGVVERAKSSKSSVRILELANGIGTKQTDVTVRDINLPGAKHGEILNYLFDYNLKSTRGVVGNTILKSILAFAETGSPVTKDTVVWDPVTPDSFNMLYLTGREIDPDVMFFKEERLGNVNQNQTKFWDEIYNSYSRPLIVPSSANSLLSLGIVIFIAQIMVRCL